MTAEENKAIVWRIYEELWDEMKLEVADELIAEGGLNYDTGLTPRPFGPEEMKGTVRMVTASPSLPGVSYFEVTAKEVERWLV